MKNELIDPKEKKCWEEIRAYYAEIFKEEPDVEVWRWCEENIYLSEIETDYPGYLDTDLTPWIREILEWVRDDEVDEITIIAGTQVCKTLYLICAIAWWAKHRGTRMMYIMDTRDNAAEFAETRLQPIFENSSALRLLKPSDPNKWNKLKMYIGRGLLSLTGSNSPGNLASRPAPFIVMDEIGKYPEKTEKETDAVSLAEERTKSKVRRKIIKASSPTYEFGLEWKSYLRGSQHIFKVRCPHCGKYIEYRKENIRWDPAAKKGAQWDMDIVRATAHYECQECGGVIHTRDKRKLNRTGQWFAQNPKAPRNIRSARIPSYYSIWPSCSWGNIAVKFLTCKAEFNLKAFDNGWDAMPSRDEVEKLDWEKLRDRKEKYPEKYPSKAAYCTGFMDVQKDRWEWFCIAWGENSEHWVVEHEIIHGDPSILAEWDETLKVVLQKRPIPLEWVFYDYGGHWHTQAIDFIRKVRRRNIQLAFGSKDDGMPEKGRITRTKIKPVTRLYEIGVSQAKTKVYKMLAQTRPGRGYCHFPDWLDDEYFEQLCAEERRPKTKQGRTYYYWQPIRKRNEALDGHVGCLCGNLQIPPARRKRLLAEMIERNRTNLKDNESVIDLGKNQENQNDKNTVKPANKPVKRKKRRKTGGWMNIT